MSNHFRFLDDWDHIYEGKLNDEGHSYIKIQAGWLILYDDHTGEPTNWYEMPTSDLFNNNPT